MGLILKAVIGVSAAIMGIMLFGFACGVAVKNTCGKSEEDNK